MAETTSNTVRDIFQNSATLKSELAGNGDFLSCIEQGGAALARTVKAGGTVYACGNGGSTCDAMHLTEELVARYKRNRAGIKAMHFMDPSVLTCWGNDFSFESAFERYAQTFCSANDTLVAISTSGNSSNVLAAVRAAKAKNTTVLGLTGKDGGELAKLADVALVVPSAATERIQEVHITIIHAWCEILETTHGLA
jgi:D-sedoheptulose 7-phosphate isomerase